MRRRAFALLAVTLGCHVEAPEPVSTSPTTLTFTVEGEDAFVFNGIATEWGEDFVFPLPAEPFDDDRTMGELAGIPMIDVSTAAGGIAIFDASPHREPVRFVVHSENGVTKVTATGGTALVKLEHSGDFSVPLRELAKRLAAQGIVTARAPAWAFEPVWETYGFEESWSKADVMRLLPLLKELGIGSVTLDSGWYGAGTKAWDARTGDYPVNEDVVGSEEDLRDLVGALHDAGMHVRFWWAPGAAAPDSDLRAAHPDWFLGQVHSSSNDTSDHYLDPTNPAVVQFHVAQVERFLSFGADGFKQDDVFEIPSSDPKVLSAYDGMFGEILAAAKRKKPDAAINTCNCGVAQNVWAMPGENMLITSDPLGSKQLRLRAKTYHALNAGGAAILADHVELTRGDVGPIDLREPGFYDSVDFASVVPLGLVLQTKLVADPGAHYRRWFDLYRTWRFFEWEWVDVPPTRSLETYVMKKDGRFVESFFANQDIDGVGVVALEPGVAYDVAALETGASLGRIVADERGAAMVAVPPSRVQVVTLTPR